MLIDNIMIIVRFITDIIIATEVSLIKKLLLHLPFASTCHLGQFMHGCGGYPLLNWLGWGKGGYLAAGGMLW